MTHPQHEKLLSTMADSLSKICKSAMAIAALEAGREPTTVEILNALEGLFEIAKQGMREGLMSESRNELNAMFMREQK